MRIIAQGIPGRIQTQVAVAWAGWHFHESFELLDCQVAFSRPRTDHGITTNDVHRIERVVFHRRNLECPATFTQGLFFPPKASVYHTQAAEKWAGIWPCANRLFLLHTRIGERGERAGRISSHFGSQRLQIIQAKLESTSAWLECICAHCTELLQRAVSRHNVALVQSEIKTRARQLRIIYRNLFKNSVSCPGIGSLS
jgi:hypothetical protein